MIENTDFKNCESKIKEKFKSKLEQYHWSYHTSYVYNNIIYIKDI